MYASIRRYRTKDNSPEAIEKVTQQTKENFVPLLKKIPGFIAYYTVNTGPGTVTAISIFESKEGLEESNQAGPSFAKEALAEYLGAVEISSGHVELAELS